MLAKILILLGSLIAVYIASKRHQIFANLMSRVGDKVASRDSRSEQTRSGPSEAQRVEPEQIEELDYDPETGRYSVRKKGPKRDS